MLADAAKHQIQFVIVYKLDRFASNRYDSAIYKTVLSATEKTTDALERIILEGLLVSTVLLSKFI